MSEAEFESQPARSALGFMLGLLVLFLLLAVLGIAFTGCASTTLYRDGKPLARFQGDMQAMRFKAGADGSFEWSGNVDHSKATTAGGGAVSKGILAGGTGVATSGLTQLIK